MQDRYISLMDFTDMKDPRRTKWPGKILKQKRIWEIETSTEDVRH